MAGLASLKARVAARFLHTREAEMRDKYRRVFDTPDGRAVLDDLLKFAGFGREVMVAGQPDTTAYILGMQRTCLRITGFLDMTDRQLIQLANQESEDHDYNEVG